MIDANAFLVMILYILGSVFLVCLIVLVVKLIYMINRVNVVLDEVDQRVQKFDRIFRVADIVTDNMALVSDRLVDGISDFVRRLFSKKKRKEDVIDE